MKNIKKWCKWTYLQNRKRLTDLEKELMVTIGEEWGRGLDWEFGIDMYTRLYLKCITNKGLPYSRGNSAQYYITTRKNLKRNRYMYIHNWPLCYTPESNTTLLINSVYVCVLVAQLCPTLYNPMDCSPPGSSVHGIFPGKNTGMGCHAPLQGIFLTQGLNPGLLRRR